MIKDEWLDALKDQIFREVLGDLERIATNVAGDMIVMVEARDGIGHRT
jgi:hypothetical protein